MSKEREELEEKEEKEGKEEIEEVEKIEKIEELKDEKAREAIKCRLHENFLVDAGAGSGKTTCLVERMVALLASGSCEPEKMAAVTFTRKAAGELKEKFQCRLEEMFRGEESGEVKERLGAALDRLERIFVGTIHSFCARLLRERPVEAGISPEFEEIEGLEEKLLEETAWEEYLQELRYREPEKLRQLGELDLSPGDIKQAFQKLNGYPDVNMVLREAPYPDLSEVRGQLEDFCKRAAEMLPPNRPEKGWDGLQQIARRALRWRRVFDISRDRYLLRLLEHMDKNAGCTYNRWPSREQAKELLEAFNHLRENYIQPTRRAWLVYRHCRLLDFLQPAVERYRRMRRRENKLNYQDLLMLSAELLKNNPEVRGYFQERYTHLLVDEFQDTDPIQAEIMFYLSGLELKEADWTNLTPRPGSLFVVGDPKQSIYRFRRADIDTYYRVKELIEKSGGETLKLTSNFRSLPALIEWTNGAFAELLAPGFPASPDAPDARDARDTPNAPESSDACDHFAPSDSRAQPPPYQAEFSPMNGVRTAKEGTEGGVFRMELEDVYRNNQEEIARQDARRAAGWISRALKGEVKLSRTEEEEKGGLTEVPVPGDFLVLVHYKKHMSFYARALEELDIPYTLSGGGNISESEELNELLHLLQALADPENPVPLAATLRGIFFGISDAHLYRFKKAGGRFSFLGKVPLEGELEEETRLVFASAWETLQRYWRWSRELPPASAVEKITSDLGIIPLSLAGELGKGRAGYVMQALELLRLREKHGDYSFPRAVEYLERLLEEGAEEELDIEGAGKPAVRIMNLHKAKGLEAPVVILANPAQSKTHETELHVKREAEEARGYICIEKRQNFRNETLAVPPCWDKYREEEEKYQAAEALRLLYVAATRAKNMLVVSTYPKKPEKSPWYPLEQYLEDKEVIAPPEGALSGSGDAGEEKEPEPVTPAMLQEARGEIAAAIDNISAPTYSRQQPSEAVNTGRQPPRSARGKGTEWGSAVHAALEEMVKSLPAGRPAEQAAFSEEEMLNLACRTLQKEGQPSSRAEELLRVLKEITGSDFWKRVRGAPERLAEASFGLWENGVYTTGSVDLAFREAGRWVLVDYKTDAVDSPEHLQALVDYYAPQLQLYRRCWESLTGEKVAEAGFFFTSVLGYVKL